MTPHVALVNSQDAPTVKHLVENAVWQLIHGNQMLVSPIHKRIIPVINIIILVFTLFSLNNHIDFKARRHVNFIAHFVFL